MIPHSSPPLRALLVDDSPGSLNTLRQIISRYTPQVEVVGEATSVEEAITLIAQKAPNLILLDIEMPRATGFDLLKKVKNQSFKVIFVTAFDQYAIEAIKFSALDYILKPIDYEEFQSAIKRAEKSFETDLEHEKLACLLENLKQPQSSFQKIAIPMQFGFQFMLIDKIVHLEAEGNYTWIFTSDGNKMLSSKKIIAYEQLLEKQGFIRCHRSHMVNIRYIHSYHKEAGGYLVLEDGTEIQIGRSKKGKVLKQIMDI